MNLLVEFLSLLRSESAGHGLELTCWRSLVVAVLTSRDKLSSSRTKSALIFIFTYGNNIKHTTRSESAGHGLELTCWRSLVVAGEA
ncbi:hypothetical protein F2Q68_00031097 [Brassica cretica]|uniref:Uncharacterized protein n=1 Tax=Brassica cretica TaxID=69181 RepID=A0A8S9G3Z1_BRACR|nr:hypothetical protein F2Q68_00031097 [Brassica cretica]